LLDICGELEGDAIEDLWTDQLRYQSRGVVPLTMTDGRYLEMVVFLTGRLLGLYSLVRHSVVQ